jgi:hypothetical protein
LLIGGTEVKHAHVGSEHSEAYWQATREQLQAAQKRADLISLSGAVALGGLLWIYHEPGDGFGHLALAGIGLALLVIGLPVWFLTRRKREITATRGLICKHCAYVPHDTEISEVAATRICPGCSNPLS